MNFNKKTIGTAYSDKSYIWVANRNQNKFIIHQDNVSFRFWFEVIKDGTIIYKSLDSGVTYSSIDETILSTEVWADEKLQRKFAKRPIENLEKKYKILSKEVENICNKHPEKDVTKELRIILDKISSM